MPFTPRTRTLIWTALIVIVMGMLVDIHLTRKYGGGDLRDKVVGSRSLLEGRSPYFEPWRPGDPERFADPMVPQGSELTRFTGSPFQALVMAPMGMVPFPAMRAGWLFLQYALLLLTIGLMLHAFGKGHRYAGLAALAFLVVIIGSSSWRLHVERGQIYVIYALIIAGLFYAVKQRRDLLLGVLGAVIILFKPTFGLLLLPLAVMLTPRILIGGVGMLVISFASFLLLPDGFNSWSEYSEAMTIWGAHPGHGAIPPPQPMDFEYPQVIEGVAHLAEHHTMETENGSISAILAVFGIWVPAMLPFVITALLMIVVAGLSWKRLDWAAGADLLLLGFCFHTILMMLLPTLRFHYQFVMWTAPLLYMLFTYRAASFSWYIAFAIAGLFVIGALELLPVNVLLAEFILLALAAIFLFHKLRGKPEARGTYHSRVGSDPVMDQVH